MKTIRPVTNTEERKVAEEKVTKASIKGTSVRKGDEPVATTEKDFQEVYKDVKRGRTGEALRRLGIQK